MTEEVGNIQVDADRCSGCGLCVQDCPLGAIKLKKKRAFVDDRCAECGACIRLCPEGALSPGDAMPAGGIQCEACPIQCRIKEGYLGACRRYRNEAGKLVRMTPLHPYEAVEAYMRPEPRERIRKPLITGIGAGTTYPDCRPAPVIVQARREDVDVVTVVTEAPLSYSSMTLKVDTDIPIGEEGSDVLVGKRKVGMVVTEQYGSKMLSIGGVNLLTGKDGMVVARSLCDLANRRPVKLRIRGGSRLTLRVGEAPIIDGEKAAKMRVGCGSATLGLFAPLLRGVADEVVVLDSHLTGLLSEHAAGRYAGARPTGVRVKFRQSTPGRYFGDHGAGWGGTSVSDPRDAVSAVDPEVAWTGMRILVTETTGQKAAMFEWSAEGGLEEVPIPPDVRPVLQTIGASCEPSRVSALYVGGAGGSARVGAVKYPVKLTRAVHEGRAHLTVGGAPVFVMPGGGITFVVDVERVKPGAFYWTPTPATICPIEYTMELEDYERMGGHLEAMRPFDAREPLVAYD